MKKKSKHSHLKRKKEFRYHKVEIISKKKKRYEKAHPSFVFLQKGNVYIYVSITHSKNITNHLAIKLRKNPNPTDDKDSYYIAEIKEDTKDRFGSPHKEWKIDEKDEIEIRNLFDKIKKDDSANHTE